MFTLIRLSTDEVGWVTVSQAGEQFHTLADIESVMASRYELDDDQLDDWFVLDTRTHATYDFWEDGTLVLRPVHPYQQRQYTI